MNRRELLAKIGFDVDEKPLQRVEQGIAGIKHTLQFFAVAEVVKGVAEMTERFAHFAEELHVAAESAGITVENFQQLAFAAKQSSVSQEELGMSMARLSRHLYESRKGGAEAQKAFLEAGFSQDQIAGFKTGSDVLLALADRFKEIKDPIQKQALAMELAGRGSVNLVGFLSQGSTAIRGTGAEFSKLGVILSTGQVNALVKVEHSMQKLWAVLESVGKAIAASIAPAISYLIDRFLKLWSSNQGIFGANWNDWAYKVTFAMGYVYGWLEIVAKKFLEFFNADELSEWASTAGGLFKDFTSYLVTLAEVAKFVGPVLLNIFLAPGRLVDHLIDRIVKLAALLAGLFHGNFFENVKDLAFMTPEQLSAKIEGPAQVPETVHRNAMAQGLVAATAAGNPNITMQSTTNIHMNSADPKEVAMRTEEAHAAAHNRVMRETGRAFFSSEAY